MIQNQEKEGFIPLVDLKPNRKGDAAVTKVNHVLGLPLTVSTRRAEPITSKAKVSDEVLVLAKPRSEEGIRKPESHEEELFLNNTFSISRTLFLRGVSKMKV